MAVFLILIITFCLFVSVMYIIYLHRTIDRLRGIVETNIKTNELLILNNKEYNSLIKKQNQYITTLKSHIIDMENVKQSQQGKVINNTVELNLDDILNKISNRGIKSLSQEELNFLKKYNN